MMQQPGLFLIPGTSIGLSRETVERMIHFTPGASPDPFPAIIDEVLHDTIPLLDLRGGYLILSVYQHYQEEKQIQAGKALLTVQKIIYQQLKKADQIAVFQCTAGKGISLYSKKMNEQGDTMKAYIADVIGSVAVEKAMDQIHTALEEEMNQEGLNITNRYSPGYCGWDVAEQQILFSLFPSGYYGIYLSETSLMDPVKSVSGIIGIGKEVKRNNYTCRICNKRDCIYKDIK